MTIGEAWAVAASSIPSNWNGPSIYQKKNDVWHAYAIERSILRPMPVNVEAPTAEEALIALAEAMKVRLGV